MFPGHRFAMFLVAKMVFGMLFLGMMLILTVNILLTILIGLDMKKRGIFNGLWIPLLLIAGIPVSIVYAIFRLGDVVGEKK
jgi:p-aminobenzoyl-glutamate transporter AbgT